MAVTGDLYGDGVPDKGATFSIEEVVQTILGDEGEAMQAVLDGNGVDAESHRAFTFTGLEPETYERLGGTVNIILQHQDAGSLWSGVAQKDSCS